MIENKNYSAPPKSTELFGAETYLTSPITGGVYSSPFLAEGYVNYGHTEDKLIQITFVRGGVDMGRIEEHSYHATFSFPHSQAPGPYSAWWAIYWRGKWYPQTDTGVGWFYVKTPPE